ncbi:MAG: hypothetical protein AAGF11_40660 [Myxococcota bacterium]
MTHLRRYLEEHGVLYPEQLAEARSRQQIYGGSLDTVLLELELVDPVTLGDLLEQACGFPIVPPDLLDNGLTRPWAEIPETMQRSRWVEPLAAEGEEIVVAVHPDLPNELLGQLLRSVRRLRPMVTPECCLEKVAAEKHHSVVPQRYAVLCAAYLSAIKRRPSVSGVYDVPHDEPPSLADGRLSTKAPEPATEPAPSTSVPVADPVPVAEPTTRSSTDATPSKTVAKSDPPATPAKGVPEPLGGHSSTRASLIDTQPIRALPPVAGSIDVEDPAPVGLPDQADQAGQAGQPDQPDQKDPPDPMDQTRPRFTLPRRALPDTIIDTRPPPESASESAAESAPQSAPQSGNSAAASSPVPSDTPGQAPPALTHSEADTPTRPPAPARPLRRNEADVRRRLEHSLAELDTERSRDTALDAILDAAMVLSPRVGLFRARDSELVGLSMAHSGLGDVGGKTVDASEGTAAGIALSQGCFSGLAPEDDLRLASGADTATPCVLQRVEVRGRPIVIIYLDREGAPIEPLDREGLENIAEVASGVFEEILRLRRLSTPAPRSPQPIASAESGPTLAVPPVRWKPASSQVQAAYGEPSEDQPSEDRPSEDQPIEPPTIEPVSSSRTSTPKSEHPTGQGPPPALVPPAVEPLPPGSWRLTPELATQALEESTPSTSDPAEDAETLLYMKVQRPTPPGPPPPSSEAGAPRPADPDTRPTRELARLGQPPEDSEPLSRDTQELGSGPPPEPGADPSAGPSAGPSSGPDSPSNSLPSSSLPDEDLAARATIHLSPPPPPLPPPPRLDVEAAPEVDVEPAAGGRRGRSNTLHGLPPPERGHRDPDEASTIDDPSSDEHTSDEHKARHADPSRSAPASTPTRVDAPDRAASTAPASTDAASNDITKTYVASNNAASNNEATRTATAGAATEAEPAPDNTDEWAEFMASEPVVGTPQRVDDDDNDDVTIISLARPIMPITARGRIELEDEDWVVPSATLTNDDEQSAIDDLIDAVIAGDTTVDRLRDLGNPGLLRLVNLFPGPLEVLRRDLRSLPPPSAHGPVIRTIIAVGSQIVPHIVDLLEHANPDVRFYAAFVFHELRDPRCMRPLAAAAFDSNGDVRVVSMRVLETYRRVEGFCAASAIVREQLDADTRNQQLHAARAVGTLRDVGGIPSLVELLTSNDRFIQEAALESLCSITGQQHGLKPHRWRNWYQEHGHRHRVEWIIDSLRHRDLPVRRWAADELVRITGHRVPFSPMGDRRSREVAAKAWTVWWEARGQAMFGS